MWSKQVDSVSALYKAFVIGDLSGNQIICMVTTYVIKNFSCLFKLLLRKI